MAGLPTTLVIALSVTGACWLMAALAYLLEAETIFVGPLIILAVVTGAAEWLIRSRH